LHDLNADVFKNKEKYVGFKFLTRVTTKIDFLDVTLRSSVDVLRHFEGTASISWI
jgi:hypothetical protein